MLPGDHEAAARHPDRALLLCWPSLGGAWAAQALRRHRGSLLIYAGEESGGCTADEEFFALRDRDFELVSQSPWHVTYTGVHCALTAWRRTAPAAAPSCGAPSPAPQHPHRTEALRPEGTGP